MHKEKHPPTVNGKSNCPKCRHWWFERLRKGCMKGPERVTYTTYELFGWGDPRDPCPDFESI